MKYKQLALLSLVCTLCLSCFKDRDDVIRNASNLEINNFIWRGLNQFYLYKPEVAPLADDAFASQAELNDFLRDFENPPNLFYSLLAPQDRFSFIVEDYIALELMLSGISQHNGMEIGFVRYPDNPSKVFAYVRYVLPNTSAENGGITRGMIFNTIDGTQITDSNYLDLIVPETYTIGLATFDGVNIIPTEEFISLSKTQYAEDPVLVKTVYEIEGERIGYLMYNGFTSSYDASLNAAFGFFASEAVTELVLDLRYNGGGSVETSSDLGSMITGQFEGQVFCTEQWNPEMQNYWLDVNPERLVNYFDDETSNGSNINNLFLDRVYVITSGATASASELIINSLKPYIQVVQIGGETVGKFQASITLYDSENFAKAEANPGHTYAMQPLVLKTVNANGVSDYVDGLAPNIELPEDYANLGILGNPEEPLLAAAIAHILGEDNITESFLVPLEEIGENGIQQPLHQEMYIENPF